MKAPAIPKPLVVSLIATPLFLLAAVASAGGGHGGYLLAKILFPFTMLSTLVFGSIVVPAMAVAILQFPIYGFILSKASLKGNLLTLSVALLVTHILGVVACFILVSDNFS